MRGVTVVVLVGAVLAATLGVLDEGGAAFAAAPPMSTPWTDEVSPTNPLPEYPRPQLVRSGWQSLNGPWQFAGAANLSAPPVGRDLAGTVLVPYPIESALSGVRRHETYAWYRRTFTVPDAWSGQRVQLNFGAVNWRAAVYLNGAGVGTHDGGYDSFSLDITPALRSGTNELLVGVYSPVDQAGIPIGKQRLNPGGITYTASSGIWQTVWLEPTNQNHITRLDTTADVPAGAVDLVVQAAGVTGQRVHAEISAAGAVVGAADGAVGAQLRVAVPDAHLWSPDDPFLYDLSVTLTGPDGGDTVTGYVGMRSIAKAVVNGFLRPVLNGRFVFQIGTLDQGYWPDGGYTAPTDEALRFDLEQQKNLGFNTVRKHLKIEPARWYYWADRLGLLVWQDMPAMRTGVVPSAADQAEFETEAHHVVDQLRGHPSIVQWEPFNEGWGEYDAAHVADLYHSWDPTRLIDANSGSNCCGSDPGNGDVIDDHIYVGPGSTRPPSASRVAVLGEFGGLGLRVSGHEWQPGAGTAYEWVPDGVALTRRYVEITDTLQGLVNARGLSASVYTQPIDVENEVNGLWTYDRRVLKVDAGQVRAANLAIRAVTSDRLATGSLVSLGVTTPGYTDRYIRHQFGLGVTSVVAAGSTDLTKLDATFWLRPGLADGSCYSFESRNYPGSYLSQNDYRIRRQDNDGTAAFAADTTFCLRTGHTAKGVSFESYSLPGRFLRHIGSEVYLGSDGGPNPWDSTTLWAEDTTWQVAAPWWRSAATLPVNQAVSLQVTTAGLGDRYLRHQNGVAITSAVDAASDRTTKLDATFVVRPGLADSGCYSFESRNYPGQFLRHSAFRLRKDPGGGDLFARDATFCAQPGLAGTDVTLASYNIGAHNIRHYAAEVWISADGGPNPPDAAAMYPPDATWRVAAPWAP